MLINEHAIEIVEIYYSSWGECIRCEDYITASLIDLKYYYREVRSKECAISWRLWYDKTKRDRQILTEKMIASYPSAPTHDFQNSKTKRIAFIFDQYSGLAHEEVSARNLDYIKRNIAYFDLHIIYAQGDKNDEHIEQASLLYGINPENIIFLKSKNYIEVGSLLNAKCRLNCYESLVYASTFELAFWASLYCTHQKQKYRIMKYYPPRVGRFTEFAGGRANQENYIEINGENYLQLSPITLELSSQSDFPLKVLPKTPIVFGSISRIQKCIDKEYQFFIFNLLKSRNDIAYFYTGKSDELSLIAHEIVDHPRAFFLGWVQPINAMQNISIYLETFPWGGGDMTLLALSLGKPYLTHLSAENIEFGICRTLLFIASASKSDRDRDIVSFSFCKSTFEMADKFNALCESIDLRIELGEAWKRVIYNYEPNLMHTWQDFILN